MPAGTSRLCSCLLTGLHDPPATHLAMLYALAGRKLVREGYSQAVARGYLWHESGDSHLLLPGDREDDDVRQETLATEVFHRP